MDSVKMVGILYRHRGSARQQCMKVLPAKLEETEANPRRHTGRKQLLSQVAFNLHMCVVAHALKHVGTQDEL